MAEVLRGGNQDRAVANDLIIPAPRHEPESHLVPVFCAEPERSVPMRDWTPDQFTVFDQACPGRQHKRELRQGYQEDVWREITATRDAVFDIVSYGGTRSTPPYSLWTLIDLLEAHGWLTPYLHPLLPLAETYQEATGAVFVLDGKFKSAELYTTPALFRQLWPKLCSSRMVSIFNAPPRTVHIADKVPGPPVFFGGCLQHPVLEQRFGFASSSSSLFSRSSSLSLRASLNSIWPNGHFQRWKLTSESLGARHPSRMFLPRSASRKVRILSSAVERLPFRWSGSFRCGPSLTAHPVQKSDVTSILKPL